MKLKYMCILSVTLLLSCREYLEDELNSVREKLVNSDSTPATVKLYKNLLNLSRESVIFGHHHSTAYGIGWRGDSARSDVKDVSGSYPGLYGWDVIDIPEYDKIPSDKIRKLVIEAYERGGVNTFCWHYGNPVTGGSFYDTTVAVKHILPGGSHHAEFRGELDKFAYYLKNLINSEGKLIPIIFRPFHEFDGFWFWWGERFCTAEEFKMLWKFTVEYLRDYRKVPNLLYAFSPDRNFYSEEEYLKRYPGDEFVDILGMDNYWDFTQEGDGIDWIKKKMKIVSDLAAIKNKIAAFTETGSEKIPDPEWWTGKLLKTFEDDGINIAWVMVWRNANKKHHYAPYPGHPSVPDFLKFKDHQIILFEEDLPALYD